MMDNEFDGLPAADDRIVYVRPVNVADLPKEVQDAAEGAEQLFAVHNADGERLAVVKDRQLAFFLARENDLAPVNVH